MGDGNADYLAALEYECERANVLIGVLRHAAKGHARAAADDPFYVAYKAARKSRWEASTTASNGS